MSSPRRVKTPSPEVDQAAIEKAAKNAAAQERYRKWKENIFMQHERSERASSATSDRAKRAIGRNRDSIKEIKDMKDRWEKGVTAIEDAGMTKAGKHQPKESLED